jgi:hypothetical protein
VSHITDFAIGSRNGSRPARAKLGLVEGDYGVSAAKVVFLECPAWFRRASFSDDEDSRRDETGEEAMQVSPPGRT